jgi:hypothetical protein
LLPQALITLLDALPDHTELTAWIHDSRFYIHVTGTSESAAEIGEQVAWLGASLRSSPYTSGIAYCSPYISDISPCNNAIQDPFLLLESNLACTVRFAIQEGDQSSTASNGQCWHNLLNKPVVVQGYPIPRRSEEDTGLEIPLNIMAGLANARHVSVFNGGLVIKGFSTMLVPTKRCENLLVWHLLYNESGDRISYLDNASPPANAVSLNDLANSRHILGWCSDSMYYAGEQHIVLSPHLVT